jgi:hypothetical protein
VVVTEVVQVSFGKMLGKLVRDLTDVKSTFEDTRKAIEDELKPPPKEPEPPDKDRPSGR